MYRLTTIIFITLPILANGFSDTKNYANSYCWAASTYQILPDPENPDQYTDIFDPIPEEGVISSEFNISLTFLYNVYE